MKRRKHFACKVLTTLLLVVSQQLHASVGITANDSSGHQERRGICYVDRQNNSIKTDLNFYKYLDEMRTYSSVSFLLADYSNDYKATGYSRPRYYDRPTDYDRATEYNRATEALASYEYSFCDLNPQVGRCLLVQDFMRSRPGQGAFSILLSSNDNKGKPIMVRSIPYGGGLPVASIIKNELKAINDPYALICKKRRSTEKNSPFPRRSVAFGNSCLLSLYHHAQKEDKYTPLYGDHDARKEYTHTLSQFLPISNGKILSLQLFSSNSTFVTKAELKPFKKQCQMELYAPGSCGIVMKGLPDRNGKVCSVQTPYGVSVAGSLNSCYKSLDEVSKFISENSTLCTNHENTFDNANQLIFTMKDAFLLSKRKKEKALRKGPTYYSKSNNKGERQTERKEDEGSSKHPVNTVTKKRSPITLIF